MIIGLLLSFSISFYIFISDFLICFHDSPHSDAIVVLTGGAGRVEEGLRLFTEGRGGFLIISGVEGSSKIDAIFPGRDLGKTVDTSKIILDIESKSTLANAANVKKVVKEKGLKSLTLVTSNYHIKRALAIFMKTMKKDVTIYPYSVDGPNFRPDSWWSDLNSLRLVFSEYYKYWWFQIQQRWMPL